MTFELDTGACGRLYLGHYMRLISSIIKASRNIVVINTSDLSVKLSATRKKFDVIRSLVDTVLIIESGKLIIAIRLSSTYDRDAGVEDIVEVPEVVAETTSAERNNDGLRVFKD